MAQGTRCAARGSGGAGGRPSTLRRPGLTAPSATEEKKEAGASRLARLRARACARALCARAPRAHLGTPARVHTLTRNGASCAPPLARAALPRDLGEALPASQGLLASTCVLAPRVSTQQRASAPRERSSRDCLAHYLAGRKRRALASFQACLLAPPPGSRDCLPAHQCWSENRPALEGDLQAHLLLAWLSA